MSELVIEKMVERKNGYMYFTKKNAEDPRFLDLRAFNRNNKEKKVEEKVVEVQSQ